MLEVQSWLVQLLKRFSFPLAVFAISRLGVLLLVAGLVYTGGTVPPKIRESIQKNGAYTYDKDFFVDAMSRWDGGQYLGIVFDGYSYHPNKKSNVAFFPLYPLSIVGGASLLGLEEPVVAVLVSHIFSLLGFCVLYDLCQSKWGSSTAKWTLVFLASFPTAFFYSAVYSESLYLFLSVLTFWCLEKKKWWAAGIVGAFAAATRIVGIVLFPVALFYILEAVKDFHGKDKLLRFGKMIFPTSLMGLGWVSYMVFLYQKFGDAFVFLWAQRNWGSNDLDILMTLEQIFDGLSAGPHNFYFPMVLSSLLALCFFVFCMKTQVKKLSNPYNFYSIVLFLIPLGIRVDSLLRYVGIIFPLFITLALQSKKVLYTWIFLMISLLLQVWFLVLFVEYRHFF